MPSGWGDDHSHYDYAYRDHGHDWHQLAGVSPDTHEHHVDQISGAAHVDHGHEISDIRKLDALVALVDGLRHDQGELISLVDELRADVRELETDRAAMLRRMRQLEDALSLPPAPADLTTADPAPFPTRGAWVNDRPPFDPELEEGGNPQ